MCCRSALGFRQRGSTCPQSTIPWRVHQLLSVNAYERCYSTAPLGQEVRIQTTLRVRVQQSEGLLSSGTAARVEGTLTGRDPLDFQLLNIIREVGLLTVLPIALYACAFSTEIEKLLDGYDWNGVRYSLSPINQRACIIARDKRSELSKRMFTKFFSTPEDRYFLESTTCLLCRSPCCATSLSADPFAAWDPDWNSRFCKSCIGDFKSRYNRYRKDAFLYLPRMFDVGSNWDQVRKDETSF